MKVFNPITIKTSEALLIQNEKDKVIIKYNNGKEVKVLSNGIILNKENADNFMMVGYCNSNGLNYGKVF